ncbi:MAG: DUF4397 domain-containing protein [Chloroflexota bacterium]
MKNGVKHIRLAVVVLVVMFSLAAAAAQAQDNRPRLRVINASLGAKNIDVYVGDTLYFRNVHYSYISDYLPVEAGERELKIRPAGIKPVDPLTSLKYPFEAERDYTMVVLGTPEKTDRQPWVLVDDNKTALTPGKTRLRIIHASFDSPGVEVCVDDQCQILAQGGVSKGDVNDYLTLDAGAHKITLRQIDAEEFFYDVVPLNFKSGEVYSIFILDPEQGEVRPRLVPVADTGTFQPCDPCDPPGPWAPGGPPGQAPLYPPVTGAFLSPTAVILLALVLAAALLGGAWLAWRRWARA